MKLNFRFSNLCGVVYKQGTVEFTPDGNCLLSPVGNRITVFDLVNHTSHTLPFETRKDITRLAVSPDGILLIVVDEDGHATLVNLVRRVVLAAFNFKEKVYAIAFSPNGKYFAVSHGKLIHIWKTPGIQKEFAPFVFHREIPGHFDRITSIEWSDDGRWILSGSRDLTVQLHPAKLAKKTGGASDKGSRPFTLAGHKDYVIRAMFGKQNTTVYTVSKDGTLFIWKWELTEEAAAKRQKTDADEEENADGPVSTDIFMSKRYRWRLVARHYFQQNSKVHSVRLHKASNLLVVGFANGIFGLYDLSMGELTNIQKLSISKSKINAVAINKTGEWLAFGAARFGQLLVWEWQSERCTSPYFVLVLVENSKTEDFSGPHDSFMIPAPGHYDSLNCVSYSAEGQYIATGGQDGKLKIWNSSNGFCFITFSEHTAAVTGAVFTAKGQSVVSSSLDGTVRAYDLIRYRNFRTFTSPTPTQFSCVAVDPSGDIVAAGSTSDFSIYVWSMSTGRLLDILEGHEGPVTSIKFSPQNPQLASASWDKTVKIWEVYSGSKAATETFQHQSDLTCIAYRPDGQQLCAATLDGQLQIWDALEGTLLCTIDGRRDIMGGRGSKDVRTAKNNASSKYFTSICYSADGRCILASGNSRFVCLYEIENKILLKKFQISHNRSIEGILDYLDSRDAHLADLENYSDSEDDDEATANTKNKIETLPGVQSGIFSKRRSQMRIRSTGISFSPSGRQWALSSSLGLLIYSLDEDMIFDPYMLDIDVTPDNIVATSAAGEHLKALVMALRLNEVSLISKVLHAVPFTEIKLMANQIHATYLQRLLTFLAEDFEKSPHLEFHLMWVLHLFMFHGNFIKEHATQMSSTLRNLQKNLLRHQQDLANTCDENQYLLEYLNIAASKKQREFIPSLAEIEEPTEVEETDDSRASKKRRRGD